jgi:hypothetical protein
MERIPYSGVSESLDLLILLSVPPSVLTNDSPAMGGVRDKLLLASLPDKTLGVIAHT